MSYRLRPDHNAKEELLRVFRKRLTKARSALTGPANERAEGIHQARKRIKEMRALLRLVRKPLGKAFAADNHLLRDTGRLLSSSRDVTAIVESWDALAATEAELFQQAPLREVRKRLASRKPEGAAGSEKETIVEALAALERFKTDMRRWNLSDEGFELYTDGLERIYRAGRKAMAEAKKNPSTHSLHEWRKRVKDHWYHSRLLRLVWPEQMKLRCTHFKELSALLGDDHDLSMLCLLMEEQPDLFGDETLRERIDSIIVARRKLLQSKALWLGSRLYAESPKALRKRLKKYWKLARRERRSQKSRG